MMSSLKCDVVIAGGGPAGSSVAMNILARHPNAKIIILDAARFPRPKLCGGAVGFLGVLSLGRIGLDLAGRSLPIENMRIQFQDLHWEVQGRPVARIVDRAVFDHWLVRNAVQRGAALYEEEPVRSVTTGPRGVEVHTPNLRISAAALVAADGGRSAVRRLVHPEYQPRLARLLEVDTQNTQYDAELIADRRLLLDFSPMARGLPGYYWDIPMAGDSPGMNRGVFDSRSVARDGASDLRPLLSRELDSRKIPLDRKGLKGCPIHAFAPEVPQSFERILFAGESAGADMLFGEGISFALEFGFVAAGAVDAALRTGDWSFRDYGDRIRSNRILAIMRRRNLMARFAFRLSDPRVLRAGWRIAARLIKLTRFGHRRWSPETDLRKNYVVG